MTNTNTDTVVDTVAPVAPAVDTVAPAAPAVDTVAPVASNDVTETVDTLIASTETHGVESVADVVETMVDEATNALASQETEAVEKPVKAKKVMVVPEMMQTDANLSHDTLREVVSQHKNAGRVLYHSTNNASFGNFNKGKSPKLQDAYLEAAAATIGYTVVTALVKNEDIGQVEEFLKTSNANAMIEMANVCEADANKASIAKAEKEAEKARLKAEKAEAKEVALAVETPTAAPMIDIDALVAE